MDDLRAAIETAVVENETAIESSQVDNSQFSSEPVEQPIESTSSGDAPAPALKSDDAAPNIEDVAGETKPEASAKPETVEQRDQRQRIDRAPQSWKGDAKKLWEQLPLQVRQEVARRERDMMPVMQQAADHKNKIEAMVGVMAPHRERIQASYGGDPLKAVDTLLRTEAVLHNGSQAQKAELLARMVKQFGVDVRALDSALAGAQLPPEIQQQSSIEQLLDQRLAPFQQFIQNQQMTEIRQRQHVEQQAAMNVEDMASDDRYPYFNDVRADMADIIELSARRGVAVSLPDAYTKAVRMNDGTFQASSTRDQSQGMTQHALESHRAAQAAKGASMSVTGSPSGTGRNVGNPSDLRGTIEAAFGGGRL